MSNKLLNISLIIFIVGLYACSKPFDKMDIYEQSLFHSHRFSNDKDSDSYRKPYEILKFIGLKQGDRVLDLLGGGGYYTELFDYIVGDQGKVYIQNNSLFLSFSSKDLDERLKDNRLKNVKRIDSEFADMQLPTNVDIVFIGLSYHDIYVPRKDPVITAKRDEFFKQLTESLKPGGILVITDHAAMPGTGNSMTGKLHRIDEAWAIKDIESAGFKLVSKSDALRNPADVYELDIWSKKTLHKTDRFVHKYQKLK